VLETARKKHSFVPRSPENQWLQRRSVQFEAGLCCVPFCAIKYRSHCEKLSPRFRRCWPGSGCLSGLSGSHPQADFRLWGRAAASAGQLGCLFFAVSRAVPNHLARQNPLEDDVQRKHVLSCPEQEMRGCTQRRWGHIGAVRNRLGPFCRDFAGIVAPGAGTAACAELFLLSQINSAPWVCGEQRPAKECSNCKTADRGAACEGSARGSGTLLSKRYCCRVCRAAACRKIRVEPCLRPRVRGTA